MSDDQNSPAPAREVGNYDLQDVIGRGATAEVWRASHRVLGTAHAIKVLHTASAHIRSRAIQEARIQATLRHPHVVRVSDVLELDGRLGLVAELVEGPTLSDWLVDAQPPLAQRILVFRQVVSAVGAAHQRGIVHRDLKPDNVLIDLSDGTPAARVTDFGLARILDAASSQRTLETQQGTVLGTPAFMAPEQFEDARKVDARADVFAMGCILYALVLSRLPFPTHDLRATAAAILGGRFVRPVVVWPEIPPELADTIEACLDPDLETRTQTCEALLADLDAALSRYNLGPAEAQKPVVASAGSGTAAAPHPPASAPIAETSLPGPTPSEQGAGFQIAPTSTGDEERPNPSATAGAHRNPPAGGRTLVPGSLVGESAAAPVPIGQGASAKAATRPLVSGMGSFLSAPGSMEDPPPSSGRRPGVLALLGLLFLGGGIGLFSWLTAPPPLAADPLPPVATDVVPVAPVPQEASEPAPAPVEPPTPAAATTRTSPTRSVEPAPSVEPPPEAAPSKAAPSEATPPDDGEDAGSAPTNDGDAADGEAAPPEAAPVESTPAPARPKTRVSFVGATAMELRDASGTYPAGSVPPGAYDVYVRFSSGGGWTHAGDVRVQSGQSVTLTCVEEMGRCGSR